MDRRSALNRVALMMGASMISSELFISCKTDHATTASPASVAKKSVLEPHKSLMADIANTIIPATGKHPGFKAINGIETAYTIMNDCYKAEDIEMVQKGLINFESVLKSKFNKSFLELSEQEKYDVINEVDKLYFNKETKEEDKPKYYGILKEAIFLSYFTDKKVLEGTMTYVKVPGKYDGAYKIDKSKYSEIYGLGV